MSKDFPITRVPHDLNGVIVSIPHYGTGALPEIKCSDYACPRYSTFPLGYTDCFARDIYGALHEAGANVIATPYSRMFVDVNRRRNDFEFSHGEVRSRKGVFRTHTVDNRPVFARGLTSHRAEKWLSRFYDPYHDELRQLIKAAVGVNDVAFLIDGHTGSPNGMGEREVILGTSHGRTAHEVLVEVTREVFESNGFDVSLETQGYSGGYIVKHYGRIRNPSVHALQIEFNAGLFTTLSRRDYIGCLVDGRAPPLRHDVLCRARRSMRAIVRAFSCLDRGAVSPR